MRAAPILLALATVCGIAGAQPADPYKTAVKLENAGSIVDALATFESIPLEKRDYNAKLHIASCKRKLGRLLEAERDYEAIRTDPKADPPTIETAASDLEDLRPKIPKIRVALSSATTNVKVTVDGAEIATPTIVPVNPGAHAIVATRAAKEVFKRELNIAEGTTLDVEIDAPAALPAAPAQTSEKPSSAYVLGKGAADQPSTPFTRTLGLVIGGVGLVAIGGGIFFAVRATDLESDAKAAAARGDASSHSVIDDARDAQLAARLALGFGALAVVGGGVLVATSVGRSPAQPIATTLRVAPAVGAAWGLALRGEF